MSDIKMTTEADHGIIGSIEVEVWHPINGKWTHIYQVNPKTPEVEYYTDGIREFPGTKPDATPD